MSYLHNIINLITKSKIKIKKLRNYSDKLHQIIILKTFLFLLLKIISEIPGKSEIEF